MEAFKTVLAIDSAMNGCGVAAAGASGRAALSALMNSGQAEHLMPMVEDVLKQAGIGYGDLDALVTTLGPGAFTGLRIGLSTAKALALSLGIPLFGITTFQALALAYAAAGEAQNCAIIIETKRIDYYMQRFDAQAKALSAPEALGVEEVQRLIQPDDILIGDGTMRYESVCAAVGFGLDPVRIRKGYDLPDMAVVIDRFTAKNCQGNIFTEHVQPLYLRGPDVSQSKTEQRVLAGS